MSWARRAPAILSVLIVLFASLATVAQADNDKGTRTGGNEIFVGVTGSAIASISTSPLALTPTFGRGIVDYVWRCQSGSNALHVTLTAVPGGSLRIGDQRGSTLTIDETMLENEALVISSPWSHAWAAASHAESSDDERADEARGRTEYWIRCLPHDFPSLQVEGSGHPPAGWYLTGNLNQAAGSGTYAMVLDNHGTPVWYRQPAGHGAQNVTLISESSGRGLPNPALAWGSNGTNGFGVDPTAAFEVFNLADHRTTSLSAPIPPTDFHELQQLPGGDFLLLSTPLRVHVDLSALHLSSDATIVDCLVQKTDQNGRLLWQWRASDHVSVAQSTRPSPGAIYGKPIFDIFHCNSVDSDLHGHFLVSMRNTDAVYFISAATGAIGWKLGGNQVTSGAPHLNIRNDPEGAIHAQHDARFQPNGDVSIYDDETGTFLAARGIEYHIDVLAGTATMTWEYASPDGQNSFATGSFRRLNRGADNIIAWGVKPGIVFTEVDQTGTPLLQIQFPGGQFAYRVTKIAPSALDHELLRGSAGLTPAPPT